MDSNHRMAASKAAALPLGDSPRQTDCIGFVRRTHGEPDQRFFLGLVLAFLDVDVATFVLSFGRLATKYFFNGFQ